MNWLGLILLHYAWQSALVALLLALLLSGMRLSRPHLRAAAAHAALVTLALLPAVTGVVLNATEAGYAVSVSSSAEADPWPRVVWNVEPSSLHLLAIAWLVWAAWDVVRLAGGSLVLWRARRAASAVAEPLHSALRRQAARLDVAMPQCLVSDRVTVPQVAGVLQPVILLPLSLLSLDAAHWEAILAHELAHLARRDQWWNALKNLVDIVGGWHPGTRYVMRAVEREREFAADDLAAGQDRRSYAEALLELEQFAGGTSAPLAATGGLLKQRIVRLVSPKDGGVAPLGTAVGFLVAAAILAAAAPGQSNSPAEPTGKPSAADRPAKAAPAAQTPAQAIPFRTTDDRIARLQRSVEALQRQMESLQRKLADEQEQLVREEANRSRAMAREAEALASKAVREFERESAEQQRRLEQAKKRFGGSETAKGKVYLRWGPPDEIESQPSGDEVWRYRNHQDLGGDAYFKFRQEKKSAVQ